MSEKVGVQIFYELSFEGAPLMELRFRFLSEEKWAINPEGYDVPAYIFKESIENKLDGVIHGVMSRGAEEEETKMGLLYKLLKNFEELPSALEEFEKEYKKEITLATVDFRFNDLYENEKVTDDPDWKMKYFPREVLLEAISMYED